MNRDSKWEHSGVWEPRNIDSTYFYQILPFYSQPFSMKWPSGVPWYMTTTWSTTYVVEKCDVMWKLPHPMLAGGSERQLRKLTFGIDLSNYDVG
ncbi:hypothetical protein AVEN_238847-1 [Araneus ventricosus]|uniref:Uncharacterized protein n=1 Tax=Araneus ventricosus TaxID=182803 RepID=A0A4Y2EKI6_ARAVE|nr:hypothetical protein AVEN_238847-1 [Araneus ventricosus]